MLYNRPSFRSHCLNVCYFLVLLDAGARVGLPPAIGPCAAMETARSVVEGGESTSVPRKSELVEALPREEKRATQVTFGSTYGSIAGTKSTASSTNPLAQEVPDGQSHLPHPNPIPSWWMNEYDCPLYSHGRHDPLPASVTDVVIIGTGITGVSCALSLIKQLSANVEDLGLNSKRSFNIVLMEAREFCSGATGRNGGHLTASSALAFKSLSEKFSQADAIRAVKLEEKCVKDLIELIESQGWAEAVDLVKGGSVRAYSTQEEKDEKARQLEMAQAAGIDISRFEWITAQARSKEYGLKEELVGGLKIPGNNLFPLKLIAQLYNHAKSIAESTDGISLNLFTHTPVLKVTQSDHSAGADVPLTWRIETSRGNFNTKYVVHATNAYASHLLPQHNANSAQAIVPTRAQVIAVQPDNAHRKPLWTCGFSANGGWDYLFQRPVSTGAKRGAIEQPLVILGGGRNHAPPDYESGVADDSGISSQVGQYLRNFLPDWFPTHFSRNDDVKVLHEWPGIMGYTKDSEPIVGQVIQNGKRVQGQYIAAGYSGHGMTRAPGCAEAVAQMVFSDWTGVKWNIPDWLPHHYLTEKDE